MADTQDQARVPRCRHHALGAGLGQRQRFLAKNLLAVFDRGAHLFFVLGMRRTQDDGIDLGILEHLLVVVE